MVGRPTVNYSSSRETKVSAAEVTDGISDRHGQIFNGSQFAWAPVEKSGGNLDRLERESV